MINVLDLLLFIIPSYVANSIPVILGGGTPLDFGKTFVDGKPIFGRGKTIRGFLAGVFGGAVAGALVVLFYSSPYFASIQLQFLGALMLSVGTMCGDAFGSFLKRRLGMDSGRPFFVDTFLFLLFSIAFVSVYALPAFYTIENLAFLFVLTIILHPLTNMLANKVGLKNVPW